MTTVILAAILALFQAIGNPAQPLQPGQQPGIVSIENTVTSLPAQVPVRSSAHEQHIQRIQDHIIDPVSGKGAATGPSLASYMAALHVPGVSIAVIEDGAIAWARGFGVARIGGPAVTPETLFQAGSISKPVSALAALRLAEAGKLDLDIDVNQYLKTWKVPENRFTEKAKVTLRTLLTHTAGMTVRGFPGYATGSPLPTVIEILNGEPSANTPRIVVYKVPGASGGYSGGGYLVVQKLLEDVTDMPFARLMQDSVLAPMGMTRSTFQQPLPASWLQAAAMPHKDDGRAVPGGPHSYPEMAPAGLWTTPSDLALYAIEVQKALAGKSAILSAAMARQMLPPEGQGLGPQIGGRKENPYFFHGGSNEGYKSYLAAYHNGNGAVIMTNGNNGVRLAYDIYTTIAHEYKWPDP